LWNQQCRTPTIRPTESCNTKFCCRQSGQNATTKVMRSWNWVMQSAGQKSRSGSGRPLRPTTLAWQLGTKRQTPLRPQSRLLVWRRSAERWNGIKHSVRSLRKGSKYGGITAGSPTRLQCSDVYTVRRTEESSGFCIFRMKGITCLPDCRIRVRFPAAIFLIIGTGLASLDTKLAVMERLGGLFDEH